MCVDGIRLPPEKSTLAVDFPPKIGLQPACNVVGAAARQCCRRRYIPFYRGLLPAQPMAWHRRRRLLCAGAWLCLWWLVDLCRLWQRTPSPPQPATWQCNQDGSISRNGVLVDASLPCNWGLLTGASQPVRGPRSARCAAAELLAAVESRKLSRRNLQVRLEMHYQSRTPHYT